MQRQARTAGIAGIVVVVLLAWSPNARAYCYWESSWTPPAINCTSPWADDVPVMAEIGSDPDDGNSQWIRWTNLETNDCTWDWLCKNTTTGADCTSNPGKLIQKVYVEGARYALDYLDILGSGNVYGCGYNLTAPVCDGQFIDLWGGETDDLREGSDIWRGSTCYGATYGSWEGDLIASSQTGAQIYADAGDDVVSLDANQSSLTTVQTESGSDQIWDYGTGIALEESCGEGADLWYGPGTKPSDCECTPSHCP